jgi:hypothetical protein
MRKISLVIAALVVGAPVLLAQSPQVKPEIRPFVGAMIPVGSQRDLFTDAALFGIQAAVELRPSLHVLGTFAWTPGQDRYGVSENNVDIFQYNLGVELGFVEPLAGNWELRPFVGAGLGGRTYAYQAGTLADRTCTAGYGALGTEFQLARTALRFEARNNVFCFRSPVAGVGSRTRNDIALSLGVAYHLR